MKKGFKGSTTMQNHTHIVDPVMLEEQARQLSNASRCGQSAASITERAYRRELVFQFGRDLSMIKDAGSVSRYLTVGRRTGRHCRCRKRGGRARGDEDRHWPGRPNAGQSFSPARSGLDLTPHHFPLPQIFHHRFGSCEAAPPAAGHPPRQLRQKQREQRFHLRQDDVRRKQPGFVLRRKQQTRRQRVEHDRLRSVHGRKRRPAESGVYKADSCI